MEEILEKGDHSTSVRVTPDVWKLIMMEKCIGETNSDTINRVFMKYNDFTYRGKVNEV